jgi:hypothetical protein
MGVYKWRKRKTQHFGDVWVPYAEVGLVRPDNAKIQSFAIQIDSGAVVSLLRRSVADLLGLDLKAGREITLGSVGGSEVTAYVHNLDCQFGEQLRLTAPFAIAEREDVPNLLGRLGIFDQLQIDFDATLHETRVTAPWLDNDTHRIWELLLDVESCVQARWAENALPELADKAVGRLLQRSRQLMATAAGLAKLRRGFDMPLIVRAMLELSVQLEHLLESPEERAELHLEYEHVSRRKYVKQIRENPEGCVARGVRESVERGAGEPHTETGYQRVKGMFPDAGRTGKVRNKWYDSRSFRDLCEQSGRLAEYKVWYKMCSGWSHADPFWCRLQRICDDRVALITAMCLHGRVLQLVADAKQIVLAGGQYDGLTKLAKGVV